MTYTNPIALTSQFGFCGLPLRLDSYRGCGFQCSYCFALHRGGATPAGQIAHATPDGLKRLLQRVFAPGSPSNGVVAQMLRRRVPVHFGGMSDPLQPVESRYKVTQAYLEALREYCHPTVFSTRSLLVAQEPYLSILSSFPAILVQISLSTTDDRIARRVEPSSPLPSVLLRVIHQLSYANIPVSVRWQPYIPEVSEDPGIFIARVAEAGAKHVGLEHLKLPVEKQSRLWGTFSNGVGCDMWQEYKQRLATRDGRELVLPANQKLQLVLKARSVAHHHGLTFGSADNDLQYLSDTACCCSGADAFPGFHGWFKHQIGYAVRSSCGKEILYSAIASEWAPDGSIDRFLNSKSRLGRRTGTAGTLKDHIREKWNHPDMPGSPSSFYGVVATCRYTADGYRVYEWETDLGRATN